MTYRRESQTLWYRIADPRIEQLFATLHRLFWRTPERLLNDNERSIRHEPCLRFPQQRPDGFLVRVPPFWTSVKRTSTRAKTSPARVTSRY